MTDVLGVAELLLGALWLLAPDEGRDAENGPVAVWATADSAANPPDGTSLVPGVVVSAGCADIVETGPEGIAWTSGAGVSTTADWVAAAGAGVESICTSLDDLDGRDMVSTAETSETGDCEVAFDLGLTVYRTTATPAPVPKSMVSICSKTIFACYTRRYMAATSHLRRCQRCYTTVSTCGAPSRPPFSWRIKNLYRTRA